MNKRTKQNEGFTIIEVVLVLAIAALIMLMVFIAWPALQRSQRDTARKNDAQTVASAIGTYRSNNNGTAPTLAQLQGYIDNLSQYDKTDTTNTFLTAAGAQGALTNTGQIRYVTGAKCTTGGATLAGSSRQSAIQIALEGNGSTAIGFCQDA